MHHRTATVAWFTVFWRGDVENTLLSCVTEGTCSPVLLAWPSLLPHLFSFYLQTVLFRLSFKGFLITQLWWGWRELESWNWQCGLDWEMSKAVIWKGLQPGKYWQLLKCQGLRVGVQVTYFSVSLFCEEPLSLIIIKITFRKRKKVSETISSQLAVVFLLLPLHLFMLTCYTVI